jgi:hypothetical protein
MIFKKIKNSVLSEVCKNRIEASYRFNGFQPINTFEPDDIFIVGYPKSGNTWMQYLVSSVIFGIDSEFQSGKLALDIVPDVHAKTHYKRYGNITFFKSHHLPNKGYKRVIYLIRDVRDTMISYYQMNKALGYDVTLEEMVVSGVSLFPCKWLRHVTEWRDNTFRADILVVRYEDLLSDTIKELKRICAFARLERSDRLLENAVTGNEIGKIREKAKMFGGMGHRKWEGEAGQKFFRKGVMGTYKEEMSPELISYLNEEAGHLLRHYNYSI